MYKLIHITKEYKTKNGIVHALDSIDLDIKNRGFYLIYGQSGSGKSTLLNLLAEFEKQTEGTIERCCSSNEIGVVFQSSNLLEELTVKENLLIFGFSLEVIEEKLSKVNLLDKLNEKVKVLSGGEKQRLSIVRAVLKDIQVLLLDEPTGNLDEINSLIVFDLLKELSKELLVIVVSHNYELASKYADCEICLEGGKLKSIVEKETIQDKTINPTNQTNTALSFFWQVKYGLKALKIKLGINILSFILIGITLLIFMAILNLVTFDLSKNLYQELKDKEYSVIEKEEYNPLLLESRAFRKGTKVKNEVQEISNHVYPYISNEKVQINLSHGIQPHIIVIPDEYTFSKPMDGTNGIVISDLLKEYYFGSKEALNTDIELSFSTDLMICTIRDKITGVLATTYTEEQYYMFKEGKYSDFARCSIYIKESVIKESLRKNIITLGGSSFVDPMPMRTYVERLNTFKTWENEEILAGRAVQDKYEILIDEEEYHHLFPKDDSFEEHEVYFKDINASPNVMFYHGTYNLYEITKSLKIVGIFKKSQQYDYLISETFMKEILTATYDFHFSGFLVNLVEEDLNPWIRKSLERNLLIVEGFEVYDFNEQRKAMTQQFLYFFVIMGSIAVLFMLYSGYNQVKYKEKEIVIFKAFRISIWRILSPFFLIELMKTLLAFCVTVGFVGPLVQQIYRVFFGKVSESFHAVWISPMFFLYTLSFCVFIVGIGILIPFVSINKKEIGIAFKDC